MLGRAARLLSSRARSVRTVSTAAAPLARRTRAPWAVAAAAGCAVGAAVAVSATSPAWLDEFESCDCVGDGLRAEFWKAKHKNVNILELESEVIQIMMTSLRDKETSDEGFKLLVERVVFFTLEHALAALPTDEKYTGVAYEDGVKLCGVAMAEDGGHLLSLLGKLWPDLPVAHLQINRGTGQMRAVPEIPDIADRHVVLLAPIMKTGGTVMKGIQRLESYGVAQENILIISITSAPAAIDMLSKKAKDVNVVCASIDAGLDSSKRLQPGLGVFSQRYGL